MWNFTFYLSLISTLAQSKAMPVDRNDDEWHLVGGDAMVNDEIELEAASVEAASYSIPSKLKAVIKFGYTEAWKNAFRGTDFNEWIAGVFTHTQAHYQLPSLGTEILFEVSLYLLCTFMIKYPDKFDPYSTFMSEISW